LPDCTPENRMDLITEYKTALALPYYVSDTEVGTIGPVPTATLDLLDSFGGVLFSCYTISDLRKHESDCAGKFFCFFVFLLLSLFFILYIKKRKI